MPTIENKGPFRPTFDSEITVHTVNSRGTIGIVHTNSSNEGSQFEPQVEGIYAIAFTFGAINTNHHYGITKNAPGNTQLLSIAASFVLASAASQEGGVGAGGRSTVSWTGHLSVSDDIRVHLNTASTPSPADRWKFTMVRVG